MSEMTKEQQSSSSVVQNVTLPILVPTNCPSGENKWSSEASGDPYQRLHTLVERHWYTDLWHSKGSSSHTSENRHWYPNSPTLQPYQLQCHPCTREDSFSHLFTGVNVNQLTWVLTSRRGASPTHNNSIWMRESTLECSPLNLSLHTWCKVRGSTWVRTQHCSFSRDKMVHSRHLSTIVQELINVHTSLSPPRPRTSPPSPHWLQQYANHVSTGSYLVTIIAPTQCREQAPDQIC